MFIGTDRHALSSLTLSSTMIKANMSDAMLLRCAAVDLVDCGRVEVKQCTFSGFALQLSECRHDFTQVRIKQVD